MMSSRELISVAMTIAGPDEALIENLSAEIERAGGHVEKVDQMQRTGMFPLPYPDLLQILSYFGSAGAGVLFLKEAKDVLVAWINARAGRKVIIAAGDKRIEIHGSTDVDDVIAALKAMSKSDDTAK